MPKAGEPRVCHPRFLCGEPVTQGQVVACLRLPALPLHSALNMRQALRRACTRARVHVGRPALYSLGEAAPLQHREKSLGNCAYGGIIPCRWALRPSTRTPTSLPRDWQRKGWSSKGQSGPKVQTRQKLARRACFSRSACYHISGWALRPSPRLPIWQSESASEQQWRGFQQGRGLR